MSRCNIIAPVSTILLQENSLKPAKQAGFFFACPPHFLNASVRFFPSNIGSIRIRDSLALCHIRVTLPPYTGFICIHATDMPDAEGVPRQAPHTAPFSASLGPILGCARPPLAGIFLSWFLPWICLGEFLSGSFLTPRSAQIIAPPSLQQARLPLS
jgi:hypothetical protein